jgi:hypothetical protein
VRQYDVAACPLCAQALLKEELGALAARLSSRAGLGRQRSTERTCSGASDPVPVPEPCPNPNGVVNPNGVAAEASPGGAALGAVSEDHAGAEPGSGPTTGSPPRAQPASIRASSAFGSSIFVAESPNSADGSGGKSRRGAAQPGGEPAPGAARPLSAFSRARGGGNGGGGGGFGSEVHLAGDGSHGSAAGAGDGGGDGLAEPLLGQNADVKEAGAAAEKPEQWYRSSLLLTLVAGYGLVAFLFNIVDEARSPGARRAAARQTGARAGGAAPCFCAACGMVKIFGLTLLVATRGALCCVHCLQAQGNPRLVVRSCMRHRKSRLAVLRGMAGAQPCAGARTPHTRPRCRVPRMGRHASRQPPCSHAAAAAVHAEPPEASASASASPDRGRARR